MPSLGGTWEPGVPTPSRRAENAAVAIDGVIYLPGGLDPDGDSLTTFEAFDTAAGTWSLLPPLPEARDHFGLAVIDDKIYLSGGSIFFSAAIREGLWVYDPAAKTWGALAPMP
ncbi:MAG: Kelch repeat-containing protein, partial [Chloroflexota bacterium]